MRGGGVRGLAFGGPLFDAAKGGIQGELQANYVLHTTQIYIKPESAQAFGELAMAIGPRRRRARG